MTHEPPQVLSLGSVNADFQVRVPRRPEISETLPGHNFVRLSGGKGANVAFLCRKLGVSSKLFGHVGEDDLAEQALAPLHACGIDLSGVSRVAGMHTGFAMITVPPDGRKGIVLAAGANEAWSPDDGARLAAALRDAPPRSVLVADCEVSNEALCDALKTARELQVRVVLDPSPASRVTPALLGLCEVVVPNSGEAQALTGISCRDPREALEAARQLHERGAPVACVKLPDGGCVLAGSRWSLHVSSLPVDVVDTTGAGDAFAGALAVALCEGRSWGDAARFAVAAAQLAVMKYGSQPSYPERPQIDELEKQLIVDSSFSA
jgi:ribokinase